MSEFPKRVIMDLDGTICTWIDNKSYHLVQPRQPIIDMVNKLYDRGCEIIIFTARGMNTYKWNAELCDEKYRDMTEDWLDNHGVKYTELIFGKPPGDLYVDDKGLNPDEFASRDIEDIFVR